MKIKLNTSLVPFFTGCYENIWEVRETDDDGNELEVEYDFKDMMKSIVEAYTNHEDEILRDLEVSFIKSIKFTGGFYSPREYNFSTDNIDFEVEVDKKELNKTLDKLATDLEFRQFLTDNFSSRSGFISFTPDNYSEIVEQIETENDHLAQSVGAVIRYLATQETLDNIEEMVYDHWQGNGYGSLDYKIVNE